VSFVICKNCGAWSNQHVVEAALHFDLHPTCHKCGYEFVAITTEGATQTDLADEQSEHGRVEAEPNGSDVSLDK